MLSNLLSMTGVAVALAIAGLAYNRGRLGKGVFVLGVVAGVAILVVAVTACSNPPPDPNDPAVAAQRLIDLDLQAYEKLVQFHDLAISKKGMDRSSECAEAFYAHLDGSAELSNAFKQTPEGQAYRETFQGVRLDDPDQVELMQAYITEHGYEMREQHLTQEIALFDAGIAACK